MEQKSLEVFESMPVPKAVFRNALPAMAAMLMVLVYNLADTFFIGQTHDALQVAAVSLATPVFLMFMAFGIGGTSVMSNCYANVIRTEGESGKAIMGQLLGNLLNVILDPIMILGFGWNIAGTAIATVIGNVFGAGYYISYFLRGKSSLSARLKDFTLKEKVCSSVLVIGIPAALGSMLMNVSQIIINSQMAEYGDMTIAGMGVAMKVVTITGMVCMGLGQGYSLC